MVKASPEQHDFYCPTPAEYFVCLMLMWMMNICDAKDPALSENAYRSFFFCSQTDTVFTLYSQFL